MHEWALAEGVISTALRVAEEKNAKKITGIKVKMGELQQVDREIFESALKEFAKRTAAEEARMDIETERSTLKCRACGHEWTPDRSKLGEDESEAIHFLPDLAPVFIRCPECGSPDFEIEMGRGVWIDSIEVEG